MVLLSATVKNARHIIRGGDGICASSFISKP